jgi:hypothetical protein
MFQLHLKVLANQAQVSAIVRDRERSNLIIRSDALEHVDRFGLQKRLGDLGTVQRREIHAPLPSETEWRVAVVNILQIMYER